MKKHNSTLNHNQKVLITGGAGFIGGCLIRTLLETSRSEIYNLDKMGYASNLDWLELSKYKGRHHLLKINLLDFERVNNKINEIKPDVIFHLAAESHVDRSIDSPRIFIENNILGTLNLLESSLIYWDKLPFMRKNKFRFLHISTDEVYGSLDAEGMFSERTAYNPRSPYAASKASTDHIVNSWYHTYGLPTLITNCSNNFGPWQFPEKLIPLTIIKAIQKEVIPIYGNGSNIRDWLFVEDHIDALIKVIQNGRIGSTYCIGSNNEKTNLEIVNQICQLLDRYNSCDIEHNSLIQFVKDRPGHDKRYAIDSSLLKKELKWKPNYDFKQSLESTVKWYLKNKRWCQKVRENSSYFGERIGRRE